jgi:predicted protein tyrosine phosphatase
MKQKLAQHHALGHDVLLMNSPNNETETVKRIRTEARDCLYMEFHDIFSPRPGLIHPTYEHVERALAWGKDKNLDEVICICQAGISRSSAMAYLLCCQVMDPSDAIKTLDINVHSPNHLIVSMGADLLTFPSDDRPQTWEENHKKWYSSTSPIMVQYREYASRQDELYTTSDVLLEIIEDKGNDSVRKALEEYNASNARMFDSLDQALGFF